jgi:hypothetical protein
MDGLAGRREVVSILGKVELAGKLRCLEEFEPYAQIGEQKQKLRKYRRFAFAPFSAVLFFEIVVFHDPSNRMWVIPVLASLGWAVLIASYDLMLKVRMMLFRCPRCSNKFGGDDRCFYCDLARHSHSRSTD